MLNAVTFLLRFCPPQRQNLFLRCRAEERLHQGLQPAAIHSRIVGIPRLDYALDPRDLGGRELKVLAGTDSAGFHTTRSWPATLSRFRSSPFPSSASRAILSCAAQINANRPNVCPLCAQERVQVQTLGVVQCQLHRFVLSGIKGWNRAEYSQRLPLRGSSP